VALEWVTAAEAEGRLRFAGLRRAVRLAMTRATARAAEAGAS
jgi:hypothetical protein